MIKKITLNLNNKTRHPINMKELETQASSILHDTKLRGIIELDLTISGKLFMQKINSNYRNIDSPTDVLSFPLNLTYRGKMTKSAIPISPDVPTHLGDIVICYDIAASQARKSGKTIEEEINFLFTHGLKHLLGFHHK